MRQDEMIVRAYCRLWKPLCGYVTKRIGCHPDVEDLVQDIFESLLKPGRLISESTVDRYIYSIAHNHIIDWYRRHACSIKAQDYFFAHSPLSIEDSDSKVNVEDIIRTEKTVLDKVGEKPRTAYLMFVHGGSSVKEIAMQMQISIRTAENHVFRMRSKVRESIRKVI